VNGIEPVALSLDNYYVDREMTPRGEDGEPDFEALEGDRPAAVSPAFGRAARREGGGDAAVQLPAWPTRDPESWFPLRLLDHQVLVIEGIHASTSGWTESDPGVEHLPNLHLGALPAGGRRTTTGSSRPMGG